MNGVYRLCIGRGVLLFVFCGTLFAQSFLPLAEVKKGMEGVGYSVFSGWEAASFKVEIIDVMRGTTPEETLILARLSGHGLENTGVIAGMSGSPVYVEGKLVGAIAYAWSFSKEALCGITPVELMVGYKKTTSKKPSVDKKRTLMGSMPFFLWGNVSEKVMTYVGSNTVDFFVKVWPIGVSGVSQERGRDFLRAGDAVAVHLVDGDVRIQAIGTVTMVSNDQVYMFGHPLFQAGRFEAPFSRAYIYGVMPAYTVSFKLGAAGEEIGSVVYDGAFGVEGRLGIKANMIPVQVSVAERGKTNTYHYRVIRSYLYQNYFLLSALFSLLETSFAAQEKNVFEIQINLMSLYQGKTNTFSYRVMSFWGQEEQTIPRLLGEMWSFFSLAGSWQQEDVRIEGIKVSITKFPAEREGFLEEVWVDKLLYQVGETVHVSVVVRDVFSRRYKYTVPVKIPLVMPPGKYHLVVGDSQGVRYYIENELKVKADIVTYGDVIRYYRFVESFVPRPDEMMIGILVPVSSLITENSLLPAFPKRYWEWLNLGSSVGREKRWFAFEPVRQRISCFLFYDVMVVSLTIQTNIRSGS